VIIFKNYSIGISLAFSDKQDFVTRYKQTQFVLSLHNDYAGIYDIELDDKHLLMRSIMGKVLNHSIIFIISIL